MSIIRTEHNKENPYVMLNKHPLSDRKLSWAAKGLWSFLISKKDDWKVSVAHLSKIFIGKGGGRDAIYSLLDELIEQGYCERKGQSQDKKGQFSKFEYVIYEFKIISPLTGSPEADEPDTDLPDTAEPATSNKRNTVKNEKEVIKETTTTRASAPDAVEKKNSFPSETIHYKTSSGKDKSIDASDIYSHFLKSNYKTETIAEAIQIVKHKNEPIGNVIKLLESICFSIEQKSQNEIKAPKPIKKESWESVPKCTAKAHVMTEEDLKKYGIKPKEKK